MQRFTGDNSDLVLLRGARFGVLLRGAGALGGVGGGLEH